MKSITSCRITARRGFTMVEILVSVVIILLLGGISVAVYSKALERGKATRSISNLRQLATANITYAADNLGQFCPAQDRRNRKRWHGERASSSSEFDPTRGYLAPYLGEESRVKTCPLFRDIVTENTFELGTGGYGYNATYVGGRPGNPFEAALLAQIPTPAQTVMFTTTALARSEGTQEYPYTEPYQWVDDQGNPVGDLQPSTHFRANGKALVAWCDGHVTAESPNDNISGDNFYGGDNEETQVGWFGPKEQNGYWNPKAEAKIFRP